MNECWNFEPKNRPLFQKLQNQLEVILEQEYQNYEKLTDSKSDVTFQDFAEYSKPPASWDQQQLVRYSKHIESNPYINQAYKNSTKAKNSTQQAVVPPPIDKSHELIVSEAHTKATSISAKPTKVEQNPSNNDNNSETIAKKHHKKGDSKKGPPSS